MFVPSPSSKDTFTVAKDSIDFNTTSSTIVEHFDGKSMRVMQYPSHNVNNGNFIPESAQLLGKRQKKTSKKVLEIPLKDTTFKQLNIPQTPFYFMLLVFRQPFCNNDEAEFTASKKSKDTLWLQKVAKKGNLDAIVPLSKCYSDHSTNTSLLETNASLLSSQKPFTH